MNTEQVLQKVNEYCQEKQFTEDTLTPEFKTNFSKFFAQKYPEEAEIDDNVINDIKFNLNTAFNATSKGITLKQQAYLAKETEFKNQIAELNKKLQEKGQPTFEMPDELKKQIEELKNFKAEAALKETRANILSIAKENIRPDLHESFLAFAKDYTVESNGDAKAQAEKLVERFSDIFKSSIGDIKPLSPKQVQNQDEELLKGVKKQTL